MHYTCIGMTKRKTRIQSAGKNIEQLELSYTAGRNAKWQSFSGKCLAGFFELYFYCLHYYSCPHFSPFAHLHPALSPPSWQVFLFKLNINLLYDLAALLLHFYPREMKTYAHTHMNLHQNNVSSIHNNKN